MPLLHILHEFIIIKNCIKVFILPQNSCQMEIFHVCYIYIDYTAYIDNVGRGKILPTQLSIEGDMFC
jgi:hypothetical protein